MSDHFTCLLRWPGWHGVRSDATDLPAIPAGWLGLISVSRTPEEASVIGPWIGEGLDLIGGHFEHNHAWDSYASVIFPDCMDQCHPSFPV